MIETQNMFKTVQHVIQARDQSPKVKNKQLKDLSLEVKAVPKAKKETDKEDE